MSEYIETKIIDGKTLAAETKHNAAQIAENFKARYGRRPMLAVILIGNDPASDVYVRNKSKDCDDCGIEHMTYRLPENTSQDKLINLIQQLNHTDEVDGILIQMPLPKHIDAKFVLNQIDYEKDVDGFTIENAGRLWTGISDCTYACTPDGIRHMLYKSLNLQDLQGKHAVIINRSNIVGKPLAAMLLDMDMTVTICHSKTKDIKNFIKHADVLITAVGQPGFIKSNDIKPGAIVIDVSMNRDENGKLCGDCEDLTGIAGYITPVPGGVGPMTRAILMQNIAMCAIHRKQV